MYERILFTTDGSPCAEQVRDHAISLADKYDAELHGIFVVNQATFAGLPADSARESIRDRQKDLGKSVTEQIIEAAEQLDVRVKTEVLEGLPHERIVEYAQEHDIDVIVMGTQGRSNLERVLLGSTAEKVLRKSSVPVHCVPCNPQDS